MNIVDPRAARRDEIESGFIKNVTHLVSQGVDDDAPLRAYFRAYAIGHLELRITTNV